MIVVSAGTGGTIAGIGRKIKEKLPHVKVICIVYSPHVQIVGVDPFGSILAQPESLNETTVTTYQVEGIGYDFIPKVLDRTIVDSWVKTNDRDSLTMARRLIREEGLLCGGSSGAAMWAAVQAAKVLGEGQRCVVILPDSVRNYMTKFLNDDWMQEQGFIAPSIDPSLAGQPWAKLPVSRLPQKLPMTILPTVTCGDCVDILHREGFDQMPVVNDMGEIMGVITEGNLMSQLIRKRVTMSDPVSKALYKRFKQVGTDATMAEVSRLLDREHFVLVLSTQRCFSDKEKVTTRTTIYSIVTRIDLLNFLTSNQS